MKSLLILSVIVVSGFLLGVVSEAKLNDLTASATQSAINTAASSTKKTPTSSSTTGSTSSPASSGQVSTASASSSDKTSNWAGYISTGSTYTTVSANWTAPTVSESEDETAADASWIGIGGVSSSDLIQVGTQNVVGADGTVETSAFYELLPDGSDDIYSVNINPGDSISASITETSSGVWQISLTDNTSGQSFSTTVYYDSSLSSAEWIEEDPSDGESEIPLDNFGTVTFTNAYTTANNTRESIDKSDAQVVTMVNEDDQSLATISGLNSSSNGFSVERTSASSVAAISEFNEDPGSWVRRGIGINPMGMFRNY